MSIARRSGALALLLGIGCADASPPDSPSGAEAGTTEAPVMITEQSVDLDPTLKTIMQGLESDMADLAHGIWVDDRDAVGLAAQGIADHPKVAPEQAAVIQGALGQEFPVFVLHDQAVHGAAVDLVEAARTSDIGLFPVYVRVQEGCVACHTQFRTRVSEALSK